MCEGRKIGKVRLSETKASASAFWAVIAFQMPIHPRLLQKVRGTGRFPAVIETDFLLFGTTRAHHQWSLSGVQQESFPYPLDATFGEPQPAGLSDRLDPEIISLAREATKGTYGNGPPSIESWKAKVKAIAKNDRAAAVMEALQVVFMFPAYLEGCSKRKGDWLCRFMADSRDLFRSEPALAALTTIAGLHGRDEQTAEKALESMYKAKPSPLCQHVALLAAFAIVMRYADPYTVTKAQKAGLPVNDLEVLQNAVRAYPYNPQYWLDLADAFSFGEWDFSTGIFLSKVALSLPMPDAMRGKDVAGRRAFLSDLPGKIPNFYP